LCSILDQGMHINTQLLKENILIQEARRDQIYLQMYIWQTPHRFTRSESSVTPSNVWLSHRVCCTTMLKYAIYKWCTRCIWFFKVFLSANSLWHSGHLYGFSPVWIRKCRVRLFWRRKDFPQMPHVQGFSPVWVRMCRVISVLSRKRLPHRIQV